MKNANAKDGYVYGNAFKEVLTITRKKSDGTLEDLSEEVKTDSTNLTYTASTSSQQASNYVESLSSGQKTSRPTMPSSLGMSLSLWSTGSSTAISHYSASS